jgi:putative ABC transport system ATP-binding protein
VTRLEAAGLPGVTRLEATGVRLHLPGRALLAGVDLQVDAGEVVALAGPSGSGKSTLLAVLAGLSPPDAGSVRVDGRPGLVLQGLALVPVLTVAENVEVALQARRLPPDEVRARAADALDRVGLGDRGDVLVEHLSGGQRQRVAVARALAPEPDVLLVDEPTSALDAVSRTLVLDLLDAVAARGAAVLVATHDAHVLARAGRVLDLTDGVLVPRP